jgi:hypothetical protein
MVILESTVNESREEIHFRRRKSNSVKWYKTWWFLISILMVIVALLISAHTYYQLTHFNSKVKINGINVGGMTAEKALEKLKNSDLKNIVYVGQHQIMDGKDTKMAFSNKDLTAVKKLLKQQWTFLPSSKTKAFSLMPTKLDPYRSEELKKQVEEKLLSMNKGLKAPVDAKVSLKDGKIVISKGEEGGQFDVASLIKNYELQGYTSEIHLKPAYLLPKTADSPAIQDQEKKLKEFLQQTASYKVQDKTYILTASDFYKDATITADLKITYVPGETIKKKIEEINKAQATLGNNFTFKTNKGNVIKVKGQGYGWALDVEKEAAQIQQAFEKGEKSVTASHIYGNGWNGKGYGFDVTTNHGIGDTYAEVSLAEQSMLIYRDGKLIVTTNVVTGNHSTHHDTSPGVWYILYKKSPSILTGRENGKIIYQVPVNYWEPFTNDGQGIHDASWRGNWASNAYLTDGSHGCVNTPASVMKTVYVNLSTYEPVIVY